MRGVGLVALQLHEQLVLVVAQMLEVLLRHARLAIEDLHPPVTQAFDLLDRQVGCQQMLVAFAVV